MLPNFLIIGAMKSGTTSLYHYLKLHPQIFMPPNKEPGFFSDPEVWSRGIGWYQRLFSGAGGYRAIGEASTNYAKFPYFPQVPKRIAATLPAVKLIYVLREPVERMYSHYLHNYYAGRERRGVDEALLTEPAYLQVSQYYAQLERYLCWFATDRIKVVLLEEMSDRPDECMRSLFRFLDVDETYRPEALGQRQHVTERKKGMDNRLMQGVKRLPFYHPISARLSASAKASLNGFLRTQVPSPGRPSLEARRTIIERLRPDIDQLSTFLRRDLSGWFGESSASGSGKSGERRMAPAVPLSSEQLEEGGKRSNGAERFTDPQ